MTRRIPCTSRVWNRESPHWVIIMWTYSVPNTRCTGDAPSRSRRWAVWHFSIAIKAIHYDKAHPLYITCLEQRKSTLGENHVDLHCSKHAMYRGRTFTLTAMGSLTFLYNNQGQYDKAHPLGTRLVIMALIVTKQCQIVHRHKHARMIHSHPIKWTYSVQGKRLVIMTLPVVECCQIVHRRECLRSLSPMAISNLLSSAAAAAVQ
jgi:hypothetical protein